MSLSFDSLADRIVMVMDTNYVHPRRILLNYIFGIIIVNVQNPNGYQEILLTWFSETQENGDEL